MTALADLPETRFAKSGGVSIAYQVMGDGPVDLLIVPGAVSHVEALHDLPGYTDYVTRLARFARVITFDKRGQGLSDRISGAPSLEERSDDVRAVLDAVGVERAAIFGESEGTIMSAYFAAAHRDRVTHLILYGGMPRILRAPDFPEGHGAERAHTFDNWGDGSVFLTHIAPSLTRRAPDAQRLAARFERLACSPGNLMALSALNTRLDVRALLPDIRVPTLVLHRATDQWVPAAMSREFSERIPGAKSILYPTGDHLSFTDWAPLCDDVEKFITGTLGAHAPEVDRVLATVMFTDIVDSTATAAAIGDTGWRKKLDEHDRIARRLVEQHRGRFIKSTGDGVLAAFDGPGRAIRCALSMTPALARLELSIRAGLHTGEVEDRGDDISGVAVNAAARVMGEAQAGEVLVSRVVADLVAGAGINFAERGEVPLKGLSGSWRLLSASL